MTQPAPGLNLGRDRLVCGLQQTPSMTLAELSIKRPVFAWMLMSALILFGGISFLRMGISQLPDVEFPVITVNLTLEGAAPEVIETEVVDVIEDALMGIQGVRSVHSASRSGQALVTVEFELNRSIDDAFQDVQSRIAQAQRRLPREMEPPELTKTNPGDQPITWIALSSDTRPLRELLLYVNDQLKDRFTTLPGVGNVQLGGFIEPNLRVWVNHQALDRYELTVTDVIDSITQGHFEPPSGTIDTARREFNLRTLGEARTVEDFERININTRGGAPNFQAIPLGELARIEKGLAEARRISRAQGRVAVGLGIQKQRGANEVAVARAVRARFKEVSASLPKDLRLTTNFDASHFIEEAVAELNFTLVLSALLTGLVCWLFLGSWSATLNVLLAIPTSIMGTFIVLSFAGFTLNTFTVLGLSLSIGLVVDDAIMVLENIVRHRERGEKRVSAALFGAREITFAATAATLAVVAIFLPVAFMKGIIGRFFFEFGVTMTVAVLLSLVEALTLTPMRSAAFLKVGERRTRIGRAVEGAFHASARLYARLLAGALRFRWVTLAGAAAFFAASLLLLPRINKEFIPSQDQGMFLVQVQTPVGSSLEFTSERVRRLEQFLGGRTEVSRYFAAIGGFTGGEVNSAIIFVTMKPQGSRGIDPEAGHELSQEEMIQLARSTFNQVPDVQAFVQDLSSRGFAATRGFPIEFAIEGSDWSRLAQASRDITGELGKTGLVTDLDSDYKPGMPEIQITPDRERAALRAVSVQDIGRTISAMIAGEVVGQYPEGEHRYDIRVQVADSRTRLIRQLKVRNNRGELIPLSELVTLRTVPTLPVINRRDRQRAITISANVAPGKSQQAAIAEAQRIAQERLPPGYRLVLSGTAQTFQESFQSLLFALALGVLVAYMVLATQFNSFSDPLTVLSALPFSISGALAALLVTGQSLNIYSMIGLILLMGLVKKNSILLVDFTNRVRDDEGSSIHEALLKACPIRLRPILMTSIAIIAGALPAALALGPGAESRIPMAVAVIGGVLVSTLLTLFVVPCLYTLLTRKNRVTPYARELAESLRNGPRAA
ncbi:MAG: efflux RND transporter permease subunit [Oligoflexia bacterium]|nr:efflux RND transporter permease subunit [Oligoflexia bacterium]